MRHSLDKHGMHTKKGKLKLKMLVGAMAPFRKVKMTHSKVSGWAGHSVVWSESNPFKSVSFKVIMLVGWLV